MIGGKRRELKDTEERGRKVETVEEMKEEADYVHEPVCSCTLC